MLCLLLVVGLNQIVWWLVVGLIAGWAAGQIMKGSGYGVVVDIVRGDATLRASPRPAKRIDLCSITSHIR